MSRLSSRHSPGAMTRSLPFQWTTCCQCKRSGLNYSPLAFKLRLISNDRKITQQRRLGEPSRASKNMMISSPLDLEDGAILDHSNRSRFEAEPNATAAARGHLHELNSDLRMNNGLTDRSYSTIQNLFQCSGTY